MNDRIKSDDFARPDKEFDSAHNTVMAFINSGRAEITPEVEDAADLMFDIAIQLGDALMLACCLARFDDFVRARRTPPWSMLEHINDAFTRYRGSGAATLNAAFGLQKEGKGRPPSWKVRLTNRTAASFIAYEIMTNGLSETKAIEKAEERLKRGDLRDVWRQYRKIVKG
jgi:hypothetical protein